MRLTQPAFVKDPQDMDGEEAAKMKLPRFEAMTTRTLLLLYKEVVITNTLLRCKPDSQRGWAISYLFGAK